MEPAHATATRERFGVRLAIALTVLYVAAVVTSLIEGRPAELPGVALGSGLLLHIERATAVFGIVVAVLSVLTQATRGRLPTQLSTAGMAYEPTVVAHVTEDLQRQVDALEAEVDRLRGLVLDDERLAR